MREWLKSIIEVGSQLQRSTLQHNVNVLTIRIEPEYGHVFVSAEMPDKTAHEAWRFDAFPDSISYETKEVPQDMAVSTGTRNI